MVIADQLGRKLNLPFTPKRIISLVPSQTELLFDLGLEHEILAITRFCVRPADKVNAKTTIGGTKNIDLALIKMLNPDLVIANKEENDREQIEELLKHCPVWISNVHDLASALAMITTVGEITGKKQQSLELAAEISNLFAGLEISPSGLSCAYLIWRKPYMVAGKGTFIDDMLRRCGLINAFSGDRYPVINNELLVEAKPDVVWLSSEPYPFKEKHISEIKQLLPYSTIQLVDGELFSWYGSRLLQAPAYFKTLLSGLGQI
jgi:ABC-type Fe3+-hydroxamate transport system substrate-binding protein